ncbi:MAG: glycosyltransferase [Burkholderiales bacterium]|nr:glycosyltransferase [Burkholderiales bacterium]
MTERMISIAICTFNRSQSLGRTLESLTALRAPDGVAWELIVIDNNSRDDTRAVAQRFAATLPLRYVFEAEQGLSAARNRALREFRGEVLLFTDDDVVVDALWLAAYAAAAQTHPQAGYLGGRVAPFYPDGRPRWLRDESEQLALIDGLLVRFHLGDAVRPFQAGEPTPFGANFALRRALIERVGEFRRDLGVTGTIPGRGEEAEYLERAIAAGASGVYVGTAIVNHATDLRRLTLPYLFRYGQQKGVAAHRMGVGGRGSPVTAATYLVRGLAQLAKGRGDRFRQCVINSGIQMALWRERRARA